ALAVDDRVEGAAGTPLLRQGTPQRVANQNWTSEWVVHRAGQAALSVTARHGIQLVVCRLLVGSVGIGGPSWPVEGVVIVRDGITVRVRQCPQAAEGIVGETRRRTCNRAGKTLEIPVSRAIVGIGGGLVLRVGHGQELASRVVGIGRCLPS